MLTLLKQYKKLLIVLSFPYLYLLFVLVAPTGQAVTAPGGLTPVNQTIEIENVDFVTNFSTVYVYSFYPITAFQSFVLANDPSMNLYPITDRQKDTTWRDDFLAGQVSKLVSLKSSLIQAYLLASEVDSNMEIDYEYRGLYVYYRPSRLKNLEIGDEIIEINGISYEGLPHETYQQLAYQVPVTYTVKRGQETFTIAYDRMDNEPWMIFYPNYEILNASPSFTLPGLESVVGGPSGGMIQTLSIYVSLLKLNIGDVKIAGTGTINMDGSVGRIGGIQQKLYTGIYNNIELFFMPTSHLSEIISMDYPFQIIAVNTIEEAVLKLYEHIYA
jgi:Lon-like protease